MKKTKMDLTEDYRAEQKERLKFAFLIIGAFGFGIAITAGIYFGLLFLAQNVSSTGGLVITTIAIFVGIILLAIGLSRHCNCYFPHFSYFKQYLCFYITR